MKAFVDFLCFSGALYGVLRVNNYADSIRIFMVFVADQQYTYIKTHFMSLYFPSDLVLNMGVFCQFVDYWDDTASITDK